MKTVMRYALLNLTLVILSSFTVHPSSFVWADGGTVRLRQRAGGYQVTVFTSPTPLRAGPVDISVLVQDAVTGAWAPEVRVIVILMAPASGRRLEGEATAEAATNRLLRAAVLDLPESGQWDVEVAINGSRGQARINFAAEVDEAQPRWLELWPWYSWPALVVVLFGVHRLLLKPERR